MAVDGRLQPLDAVRVPVRRPGLPPAAPIRPTLAAGEVGHRRSGRSRRVADRRRCRGGNTRHPPQSALGRTLRVPAVELVAEIRRLDRRIASVAVQICAASPSPAPPSPNSRHQRPARRRILAQTAGVDRFRSVAALVSYCGVAPLEASSGDVKGHRLSRAGDRQLDSALHIMAITQIRCQTAEKAYFCRGLHGISGNVVSPCLPERDRLCYRKFYCQRSC
jgi:transposase